LISEDVLEQALAQVFDGKLAGESMSLEDITAVWNTLGLRKSDLREAIHQMIEQLCLETQNSMGNTAFMLTAHGAVRFYICLYCEANLQHWLRDRRLVEPDQTGTSAFGEAWDRRLPQC